MSNEKKFLFFIIFAVAIAALVIAVIGYNDDVSDNSAKIFDGYNENDISTNKTISVITDKNKPYQLETCTAGLRGRVKMIVNHVSQRAWSSIGTDSDIDNIRCVDIDDVTGNIYVGGQFPGGIKMFDGQSWKLVGTTGCSGIVHTIKITQSPLTVIIGGEFTDADSVANTAYITYWDGSAYHPVGTNSAAIVNGAVIAADYDNTTGHLWIAGTFANSALSYLDGTLAAGTWTEIVASTDLADLLTCMTIDQSSQKVVMGGNFPAGAAVGGVTNYNNIISYNINSTTWNGLLGGLDNTVKDLHYHNSKVYVAGMFESTADSLNLNKIMRYVAVYDGTSWDSIGHGIPAQGRSITIDKDSGIIYVSGDFASISRDVPARNYAKFTNTGGWETLEDGLSQPAASMTVSNKVLYVGGINSFESFPNAIAKFDTMSNPLICTVNNEDVEILPQHTKEYTCIADSGGQYNWAPINRLGFVE